MAFKPFLRKASFNYQENTLNLLIEHKDGAVSIFRDYDVDLNVLSTANQIKSFVLTKNSNLQAKPGVVATIEALLDTEIN